VGLEQGPLSLVSITEELLEWNTSGSGSRELRLPAMGILRADHATSSVCKMLALTLSTSGGRSLGIVRLRTKATEVSFSFICLNVYFAFFDTCCYYFGMFMVSLLASDMDYLHLFEYRSQFNNVFNVNPGNQVSTIAFSLHYCLLGIIFI
jgi:hypothetical protein